MQDDSQIHQSRSHEGYSDNGSHDLYQLDPRLRAYRSYRPKPYLQSEEYATVGACQCSLVDILQEAVTPGLSLDNQPRFENLGRPSSNLQFLISQNHERAPRRKVDAMLPESTVDLSSVGSRTSLESANEAEGQIYVEAFMKHVNPGYPIFDNDDIVSLQVSEPTQNLVLYATMLVGAQLELEKTGRESTIRRLYQTAKMLFHSDSTHTNENLVQAALLLSWYSDPFDESPGSTAWYWINVARTLAVDLGMHRDVERSALSARQKARWRRLWWLIYQSEVQISLQLGRPLATHLEDCDVKMLQENDFEACNGDTQIESVIALTTLSIVIADVPRRYLRPRITTQQRHTGRLETDHELSVWRMDQSAHMLAEQAHPTYSSSTFLWLYYYSALLILHRPDPEEKRLITTCTPTDMAICIIASHRIHSIVQKLQQQDQIKSVPHHVVHILFTAAIEFGVEAQLPDSSLAQEAHAKYNSMKTVLEAVSSFWPGARSILDRLSTSAAVMAESKSRVDSDLGQLVVDSPQDMGLQRGYEGAQSEDESAMDMETTNGGIDRAVQNKLEMLFGSAFTAEELPDTRHWKEWRQIYWRWSHIRCV